MAGDVDCRSSDAYECRPAADHNSIVFEGAGGIRNACRTWNQLLFKFVRLQPDLCCNRRRLHLRLSAQQKEQLYASRFPHYARLPVYDELFERFAAVLDSLRADRSAHVRTSGALRVRLAAVVARCSSVRAAICVFLLSGSLLHAAQRQAQLCDLLLFCSELYRADHRGDVFSDARAVPLRP